MNSYLPESIVAQEDAVAQLVSQYGSLKQVTDQLEAFDLSSEAESLNLMSRNMEHPRGEGGNQFKADPANPGAHDIKAGWGFNMEGGESGDWRWHYDTSECGNNVTFSDEYVFIDVNNVNRRKMFFETSYYASGSCFVYFLYERPYMVNRGWAQRNPTSKMYLAFY